MRLYPPFGRNPLIKYLNLIVFSLRVINSSSSSILQTYPIQICFFFHNTAISGSLSIQLINIFVTANWNLLQFVACFDLICVLHFNNKIQVEMTDNKTLPIGEQEIPVCSICRLQPSPESSQYPVIVVLQILLLFYSLKLSAIAFLMGFCFSQTKWLCPQCKREIEIGFEVPGSSQNIILKMGNCMVMLSKFKFRIIAGIIIAYLTYLFAIEFKEKPKFTLQKSWKSLANNCGYEAYLQNQFKANSLYSEYPRFGQWTIDTIFLREKAVPQQSITRLFVKMNPTQFKNNLTQDLVIYKTHQTHSTEQKHQLGDILRVTGQWEGREDNGHVFRFVANKIEKTGDKANLNEVKLINAAQKFIRVHQQEQKVHANANSQQAKSQNKNT